MYVRKRGNKEERVPAHGIISKYSSLTERNSESERGDGRGETSFGCGENGGEGENKT